ncbi:bactofilin family protein [Chlamydia gallinacea]|uniref:Polymer-forming cytoskeletal family protein n=2 Tax=Chlamydia gallinacea TaxID=1457153 RepID=A0A173DZQ0_9CHLA|nr:polymer-forming cytoskeletal protein [Chlamydia gallinacea]EYE62924.1 polymer-forming cytoskeletal family protein [Bacteroides fragilis str. S6L5]ANG66399.1 polymer-forming cytoskeletal family protein [Chlamydia gallinacea 08-1274/3]AQT77406.1 polymer-forming cytoskeletal family protein [Chlamydia gallinacea]MBX6680159.1 polymer-forming cytoskeletal protein [Chlamydia gallinacea]MBX6687673.1 polymer-forming cytoskeletal protein [Chlamydia gallinacea]
MFRRSGKSPFEDVQTLYEEEAPSHSNYSYSRTEHLDSPPNLFDTPKSVETRPLSSYPVNEETQKWTSSSSEIEPSFLVSEEPETTLGEGVTFKGELAFERLLRIDGTFEGILVSQGKIIIGPKGYVKADIQLQEAIIEGVVEGNITVTGKVELRGEAMVKGDIQAATLCVDEGVRLLGYVAISGLPEDPQKD